MPAPTRVQRHGIQFQWKMQKDVRHQELLECQEQSDMACTDACWTVPGEVLNPGRQSTISVPHLQQCGAAGAYHVVWGGCAEQPKYECENSSAKESDAAPLCVTQDSPRVCAHHCPTKHNAGDEAFLIWGDIPHTLHLHTHSMDHEHSR